MTQVLDSERKTLILTGASRGIGHATVKRFSTAGWRVISCSRHPFPEDCPWDAGPDDHIQVDLADSVDTARAILLPPLPFSSSRLPPPPSADTSLAGIPNVERFGDLLRRQLFLEVSGRPEAADPVQFVRSWPVGDPVQQGGGGQSLG